MSGTTKNRILVVDDEPSIREVMAMRFRAEGYEVSTAEHGFDALLQLRSTLPDIIISDLNMPHMSGFEFLSVVGRRFPEIPVIAFSGAYGSDDGVPDGVIADAFWAKGRNSADLLRIVAELIRSTVSRSAAHPKLSAPVWITRNGTDAKEVDFVMLTCTQCLRSFPLSDIKESLQEIQETPCLFCDSPVRYIIDSSTEASSPKAPNEASVVTSALQRQSSEQGVQKAS